MTDTTAIRATGTHSACDYEVVIIGAGVAGIYQLYRLLELGVPTYRARARRRSWWHVVLESVSGVPFRLGELHLRLFVFQELLDEWHWKERFSGQPDNLRYLNYVADKFDLRKDMQFDCKVESAISTRTRTLAVAPRGRP
jgi:cation diffusion facilitator CzcD-associated flavoprotein CzcO